MGRISLLLILVAACGGVQVPQHNGYKSDKVKPWKHPKTLKFDDKGEAKAEGDLSYPDMRRAVWFLAELPSAGDVDVKVEITPPGDAVNDNFDLGMEVLDPANRPVTRWDLEEGGDAGELNKVKNLKDLAPGKYLVHLYLQGRLDTADYVLHVTFHPSGSKVAASSDFPAQVAFLPPLAVVPITDDTPKSYKPPTTVVVTHTTAHHHDTPPPKKDPPPASTLQARIIGLAVVAGGTQITVGRGTSGGAAAGMKGTITGIPNGSFTLAACNERTCTATVSATPDQIKSSGNVVLTP